MASRDHALTTCGVVLWLARRVTGWALLMFAGPIAFAVFGIKHQYGTHDFFWLKTGGDTALLLGGWLLFGPQVSQPIREEP